MELLYYVVPAAAVLVVAVVVVVIQLQSPRQAPPPAGQDDLPLADELVESREAFAPGESDEAIPEPLAEELDARVGKLHQLLAEVDQRIEELRRLSTDALAASNLARSALERQHREVLRLSRQGLDAVEVARRLELDVGEVELMLNLQRCRVPTEES
jgi:hypothetical protein